MTAEKVAQRLNVIFLTNPEAASYQIRFQGGQGGVQRIAIERNEIVFYTGRH